MTAEEILNNKTKRTIVSVHSNSTIYTALEKMHDEKIGAIVVTELEEIVGIFTERDLLHYIIQKDFDPESALIKDYMTTDLIYASFDEDINYLNDKFLGKRIRHLFIKKDEKFIGMLSAGDVLRASLNENLAQLKSISWDYYENWCWKKK